MAREALHCVRGVRADPDDRHARRRTFPLMRVRSGAMLAGLAAYSALAVLAPAASAPAAAGDASAGRRKAIACQTCHGLDGLSKLPEAPSLAGQPEQYLIKSLDDYRSGARKNEMMSLVVKTLSDQDIADLAAYYAAIEISTTPPK
jgi:cytochrome c553